MYAVLLHVNPLAYVTRYVQCLCMVRCSLPDRFRLCACCVACLEHALASLRRPGIAYVLNCKLNCLWNCRLFCLLSGLLNCRANCIRIELPTYARIRWPTYRIAYCFICLLNCLRIDLHIELPIGLPMELRVGLPIELLVEFRSQSIFQKLLLMS